VTPPRRHPCLAPWCTVSTPPPTVFHAPPLNPTRFLVTQPAADTPVCFPALSARCLSPQPPTRPNRRRSRRTIARVYTCR
jgi:hypothetical protein